MKKATLDQASKILSVFEDTPLEQVQSLLESGFLADLRDADIAQINRDQFRRGVGLKPLETAVLLRHLGIIAVPATTERFIASEKFVINTDRNDQVKISYLGDNFKGCFLSKTEAPIQETVLRYQKLVWSSTDDFIIAELGGEAKAETTLAQVFALMQIQKNGEAGVLFNNGWENIFHVRDTNGVLRAVGIDWRFGGWRAYTGFVGGRGGWRGGCQVFSSNS